MPAFVGYLLLFVALAVFFVFIHLVIGTLIRPIKPDAEKLTIYECGEPTVGSAWIQFDVRFYVVALLFVVFDVEVAFFFPWAVVFGKANDLARPDLPIEQRIALSQELQPALLNKRTELQQLRRDKDSLRAKEGVDVAEVDRDIAKIDQETVALDDSVAHNAAAAQRFTWIAFIDILVFFGVLLVGYAYLWKRGDLDWVRSYTVEQPVPHPAPPKDAKLAELVGAGREG